MFCPNCGTQNIDTAATCTKCGSQLKAAGAPAGGGAKFKGTMLMMNQPPMGQTPAPGAAVPTPPPAAPTPSANPAPAAPAASGGPPRPMPNKLKGTMVGVAPPNLMGAAPPPSSPQPATPAAFQPPAADPAPAFAPTPEAPISPGYGAPGGSPVNPLGGTVAAGDSPFASGGPYAGGGAAGGYGGAPQGPGYGAPQGAPAPEGNLGNPYGTPPAYGAPQGAPQTYGQDFGAQNPGGNPAAMQPMGGGYGGGPMMGGPGGMGGGGGPRGAKGEVRNPMMVLVYSLVSCGLYQILWMMWICNEINAFLQREAISFWKVFLLTNVTCGLYGIYWLFTQFGPVMQEVQQRAGLQTQVNPIMYFIPYYNVIKIQEELNAAWSAPG